MENFERGFEMIVEQLETGSIVWLVLFCILLAATVVYLIRGIYIHSKRAVESVNFIIICAPIVVWSLSKLSSPLLGWDNSEGTWLWLAIACAGLLVPTLLMFHIWSQTSYKPITAINRIAWLVVPALLIANEALKMYDMALDFGSIPGDRVEILTLITNIYFVVVIIKAYLLCFNVFYQMPKHMRRSTYQMLIAISAVVVVHVAALYLAVAVNISDVMLAVAYIIVMHTLFTAFFIANSSNVIATSRDFVFSSLSTIVITVSLKGNILDWNHKEKNGCRPLPDPKYKEPYPLYKKRILDECDGTISPHDENILNIKAGGGENHFLFTWHEIAWFGRKFGYLVEIAEVTTSYSKLRYIEAIAYYDNLTSLHNRNAYIEHVKNVSDPANMPLLIIVGDVNNLKKTNDTLGHLYGDKLLLTITKVVGEKAPENAFTARIGGDELVLLVPNADERDAIAFMAAVTETLNAINDPDIGTPSISWGYSVMYNASDSYNDVFRAADAIMYEAKRRSREVSITGVVPQ